jgi:hypothetical protein
MRLSRCLIAGVMFSIGSGALAGECIGLTQLRKEVRIDLADKAIAITCGSLTSVASKILNRARIGGRKLEQERPLNVAEAQANVDTALRDGAVRQRIEQVGRDVKDANARLVYEAAIFDEEGFYSARDLRIQQLSERLK